MIYFCITNDGYETPMTTDGRYVTTRGMSQITLGGNMYNTIHFMPWNENEQLIRCESTSSQYDISDDTRIRQESIGSQCDLFSSSNDIEHQ